MQQMSAQQQAQVAYQQNMAARIAVLQGALNMWQPIFATTLTSPAYGTVLNVPVRQIGLTKRFLIKVQFTVAQSAAETQTLTKLGPANIFSNVTLNDLSNYTRVNTTGWHLFMLQCMKQAFFTGPAGQGKTDFQPAPSVFGSAYTNDSPIQAKAGAAVINAPATVTTAQSGTMYFEVPVSYSDADLRGAIYTSVVSATMYLQMTINQNFGVGSAGDPTLAVYQSSTAGNLVNITSMTITVYQNFLDQIPLGQNGPVLPAQDISKMYLLTNGSFTALAAGQDFPIVFPNFRAWQSLAVLYDNAAVTNYGTDISLFQLQTANLSNIRQLDPATQLLFQRIMLKNDFTAGAYMFDFRDKPINTNQFGNMQITIRPTASTGTLLVGYEGIGIANQVINAGSIPSN
jgi:P3 major capsid protein